MMSRPSPRKPYRPTGRVRPQAAPLPAPTTAPLAAPLAPTGRAAGKAVLAGHPLADRAQTARLRAYEQTVKSAFDRIVPVLRTIAGLVGSEDFTNRAQAMARAELGFELPVSVLNRAWISGLDGRALFAWAVFETVRAFTDRFHVEDPLGGRSDRAFDAFLHGCGFHTLDISPCADGRLAHVISYALRLPYKSVRRRSHAGAMFDVEDSVRKWVEVEMLRHREGRPTPADEPTRYLKAVVYHTSDSLPCAEGCAAHGSDTRAAALAGLGRLLAFRQAIENGFCCGASIDLLLIGLDTDSDAIRVHVPDARGAIDLEDPLDVRQFMADTRDLPPGNAQLMAESWVRDRLERRDMGAPAEGMIRLVARLLVGNLSQVDAVAEAHGGCYPDIGHAERFIGLGMGFEEVQMRNLTYLAFLDTVEEGAPDLDVGIKIFSGLNVARGLPIPTVVRFDYHGTVPGARDRAVARCLRTEAAFLGRYPDLAAGGLLHTVCMVRDLTANGPLDVVGGTLHGAPLDGAPLDGAPLNGALANAGGH